MASGITRPFLLIDGRGGGNLDGFGGGVLAGVSVSAYLHMALKCPVLPQEPQVILQVRRHSACDKHNSVMEW